MKLIEQIVSNNPLGVSTIVEKALNQKLALAIAESRSAVAKEVYGEVPKETADEPKA